MSKAMMTVDDEKLVQLFKALDPKKRKSAIKGALRRAANIVLKEARKNLKESKVNDTTGLSKGIRRVIYKEKLGFRVTIGTKSLKGRYKGKRNGVRRYSRARMTWSNFSYHVNRQGKEKPVLIWAEGGTKSRHTKTESSWRGSRRKRRGHFTGSMPRYGFMEKTRKEVTPQVDSMLKREINLNIQRIAKRYGCTVT